MPIFPVNYSILSAQALATDVLPGYGVGDIVECSFFSTGFNDTYRVKTAQGGVYYLRVYRLRWRSLSDICYELDVLGHLHGKGISVACPLPHQDGKLVCELLAPEGRRYAALFAQAPGPLISYDHEADKIAFQYGQAVARLHNAAQDFASPHARFHIDLDHLIDIPLKYIEPFLLHRADDWRFLQKFAQTVRQRILALPANALEQGFCHGDLQGYHANVGTDGTLTFFDFDCCGYGYRAYDLAVFRWCSRLKEREQVWWKPYLNGYRETRPLNDVDVLAIPLFVCARYIWHMGVHTQNAYDWGCGWLNDEYFDQKLQYLRELEADYDWVKLLSYCTNDELTVKEKS